MICKTSNVDLKRLCSTSPHQTVKVAFQHFPNPDVVDSEKQLARPTMLVDFLQPAFKIFQCSGFFPYELKNTPTSDPQSRLVLSTKRLIIGTIFGLIMGATHVYGLINYLKGLQGLMAKLPKSGLVCIWVGVLVPTVNACLSSAAIIFANNRAIKVLLSMKFPETDGGVQKRYDEDPEKPTNSNSILKKTKKYVIIQVIGSVFLLVCYGCLGKHRTGKWIDGLDGLLYSLSYFILFGFIDTFQHTFLYVVELMTEDLRASLKKMADEFESEPGGVQVSAGMEPLNVRLRQLRKRHLILAQLPGQLAEAMAPVPFFDCLAFGLVVTTQIFVAILIFDMDGMGGFMWDAVALSFNSIICVGRLVHTCFLTAALEDQMKSLKPQLFAFGPGNLSDEVSSEARAFIQQATILEPVFSASGYFTLNKSAITGALSTVATYLIIFGEFHVSEMEVNSTGTSG